MASDLTARQNLEALTEGYAANVAQGDLPPTDKALQILEIYRKGITLSRIFQQYVLAMQLYKKAEPWLQAAGDAAPTPLLDFYSQSHHKFDANKYPHLTEGEWELLGLLSTGMGNKAIAQRLSIKENTVKTYVRIIFTKLGVESRTQAAIYAVKKGLANGKQEQGTGLTQLQALETIAAGDAAPTPLLDFYSQSHHKFDANKYPHLTEMEWELLGLLSTGMENKAIAQRLFWAEITVKKNFLRLYAKIGAKNRIQAAVYAVKHGITYEPAEASTGDSIPPDATPDADLSEQQKHVLLLLALGMGNKAIAQRLSIKENTVKTYVRIILIKLGVESRTQAAIYAVKNGLANGKQEQGTGLTPPQALETIIA